MKKTAKNKWREKRNQSDILGLNLLLEEKIVFWVVGNINEVVECVRKNVRVVMCVCLRTHVRVTCTLCHWVLTDFLLKFNKMKTMAVVSNWHASLGGVSEGFLFSI